MRWIALLALLLLLTGTSRAAGPDDQYLDIYNEIQQADSLRQIGHAPEAAAKYLEAETALKTLQQAHPAWNVEVVSFRLEYLAEQLQALAKTAPVTNAPPPQPRGPAKSEIEAANLQEQVRSLTAANIGLENKLKEALSIQPAAVSSRELAKAEEKNIALQKEKDLLAVALEQAKAARPPSASSPETDKTARQLAEANQALADVKARSSQETKTARAEMERLKGSLAESQKKIDADAAEIETLKSSHSTEGSKEIAAERDKLKEELAARTKDLADAGAQTQQLKDSLAESQKKIDADTAEIETLKSPRATEGSKEIAAERDKLKEELAARTKDLADAEAHRDQSTAQLRAQLAEVERQRDELKTKPAAAPAAAPATTDAQVDQLRARLAVLEAQTVPYTAEELAVLNKNPSPVPARLPAPAAERRHAVHSMKDLPPGAGALMMEAARAAMERNYTAAVEKYQEILRQDENNVYVLAYLAKAQFHMGQLPDCEKTVMRALALDADDPASLYLLGIVRFRQERLDDALNALSLSAKYNPTNSDTQNYLGCVLADKGLRPAAETAFRKSLQADPKNADAHYNVSFLYAEDKPPSMELARWHYRRAVDLGHPKSQELEQLLGPSP